MVARKPRILIASSSEGLASAEAVQRILAPAVEAVLWNQSFFTPGSYPLETLEERSREFDGALVVATADDRVMSRGDSQQAPRDNLILEYGLFVAAFGRRRALLMVQEVSDTRLPSDVAGLTVLAFDVTDPPDVGVASAATRIRDLAKSWRDRRLDDRVVARLERVLRIAIADIQERASVAGDLGVHVFLVDPRAEPPVLERVARARTSPKPPRNWPRFLKGEGVVGRCWERGTSIAFDFTTDAIRNMTRDTWENLDSPARCGMDFDMLELSRQRYKFIGAVPITTIRAGGTLLGCISYNLGIASPASANQLSEPGVERAIDTCVEMVSIVLDDA